MKFNEEQDLAITKAKLGHNLFITGSGGVGKSVVIRELESIFKDTAILVAPTGIAALNIGGTTLHSIFSLPFTIATESDYYSTNKKAQDLFRYNDNVKTIIIDEISMVRADYFICIDRKLKHLKSNDLPFGGLQVIVVGDFYQLSPVLKPSAQETFYKINSSIYCFDTDEWDEAKFQIIQLNKIMRQSDEVTIRAFNSIRKGLNYKKTIEWLNKKCKDNNHTDDDIILSTTNRNVESLNHEKFNEIDGEIFTYYSSTTGKFKEEPVPSELQLKVGCKVLICANNHQSGYVNGQTGIVERCHEEYISVRLLKSNNLVFIQKHTWNEYSYSTVDGKLSKDITGTYLQFPLKLGYALTIHKCQGMTLDNCHIDLGRGAFAHGQTYVALSRIKDLNNLTLERPIYESDIIVDKDVKEFQQYINQL